MACKVRYLSSAGIQHREIKGLDALAEALPINWLVYASLNAFPRNGSPIEIDVIAVMDDRIVLLELKDWNGKLTSNGDNWMLGRSKRGRSAVALGNDKAKKVKGMIRDQIPQLGGVYVDSRVVLTGTATREFLPAAEQPYVLTLDEARLLGDPKERNRLLGRVNLSKTRPNMFVKDFERLFGNASYFQPLKMDWDGYGVTDEDFYVHRGDVWREHRAHRNRQERVKALLRLWRFDRLPAGLNDPDGRRLIAERETGVRAYLGEQGSWMADRGMLTEVGSQPDEILTQHHQLLSVPTGWTTLRRYLATYGEELTGEQRIDIAHTLASMVAELHAHGVAHRDIGGDCVWLGAPTSMSLTGFFSARTPEERSVAEFLEVLATYADPEPDWDGVACTATERDVRSLGLFMKELAALGGDATSLPQGWDEVADRAIAAPGERYADARLLAEALGELRTPSGPLVDQSRLDDFETRDIPYAAFPPADAPITGSRSTHYSSGTGPDLRFVKVWNGVLRGDARRDHSLLALLETAASLHSVPARGVARVVASGLSPVGPYVVTDFVKGATLDEAHPTDLDAMLRLTAELASIVAGLHSRELAHGDLHPGNVLVGEDGAVTLIDMLDLAPLGQGRVRSPAWAPADHERRSDQEIDRFALCRMVATLAGAGTDPALATITAVAEAEMERPVIETLDVLEEAIEVERRRLLAPPAQIFRVSLPTLPDAVIEADDGHLWVRSYRVGPATESFFITGLNSRLFVRTKDGQVDAVELTEARIEMRVSVARGIEGGFGELIRFLRDAVAPEESQPAQPAAEPDLADDSWDSSDEDARMVGDETATLPVSSPLGALDVARLWQRAAEIEEDSVLTVRLDTRLADLGGAAVFRYETPRPLEFEDEDIVEVRLAPGVQGRRLGKLDVARCDGSQIAIRDLRGPIAGGGEHVALIDRRDRVSKERRRRAVDRVTARRSVIPDLIDYFDPQFEAPEETYDLSALDEDLRAYGLNEGQRKAFAHFLASGPVGLLQGPPGSGKTRFIASFVHWLLTEGGARRVLVASQSHEAVNNVLEELLRTYRAHGGHADLLRVGSRGATERVRPFQARSLRERYRVRFENGLKSRVAHAAGIPRAFVYDVVGIDQRLGTLQRALELARKAAEGDMGRDERRKSDTRLRSLHRSFAANATEVLQRPIDETRCEADGAAALVEEAYATTLAAHPKCSLGDLATARRLLALAHEWKDTLGAGHRNFDEFLAKTRRVVAGTCVGLGQSQIRLEGAAFDWVIVDEAARCTSGELAVPLQMGSRVVLVGDQRQLRPMVERAVQSGLREEFDRVPRADLERSDFERAFASSYGQRNAMVLDEQYRMTPVISDMVSSIFYAPHGVTLRPSKDRKPDLAFAKLPADIAEPVVWYDTTQSDAAGERQRNGGRDIWNDAEIEAVLAILQRYAREPELVEELSRRPDPAIGVICMYSEQKRRIEREWSQRPFPEAFRRLVTIDTVDAYQGKENAVVILSLVRANQEFVSGHVGRENRCNVAISRAKERLYIVGSTRMWGSPRSRSPMHQVLAHVRDLKEGSGRVRPASEIDR